MKSWAQKTKISKVCHKHIFWYFEHQLGNIIECLAYHCSFVLRSVQHYRSDVRPGKLMLITNDNVKNSVAGCVGRDIICNLMNGHFSENVLLSLNYDQNSTLFRNFLKHRCTHWVRNWMLALKKCTQIKTMLKFMKWCGTLTDFEFQRRDQQFSENELGQ